MSTRKGSGADLTNRLLRMGPECLDLMTARNDAQFEKAFDVLLKQVVEDLEQNKKLFKKLGEDGLSSVVAMGLKNFGVVVTRETNSNGHVDITIVVGLCRPKRRMLCEAKIYKGPQYHVDGLKQLLGRYTTGREGRGLMLTYVRKKNIVGLMRKVRDTMDASPPMNQQGKTADHNDLLWSFISTHRHSSGQDLKVCHVGCNLCTS